MQEKKLEPAIVDCGFQANTGGEVGGIVNLKTGTPSRSSPPTLPMNQGTGGLALHDLTREA